MVRIDVFAIEGNAAEYAGAYPSDSTYSKLNGSGRAYFWGAALADIWGVPVLNPVRDRDDKMFGDFFGMGGPGVFGVRSHIADEVKALLGDDAEFLPCKIGGEFDEDVFACNIVRTRALVDHTANPGETNYRRFSFIPLELSRSEVVRDVGHTLQIFTAEGTELPGLRSAVTENGWTGLRFEQVVFPKHGGGR